MGYHNVECVMTQRYGDFYVDLEKKQTLAQRPESFTQTFFRFL